MDHEVILFCQQLAMVLMQQSIWVIFVDTQVSMHYDKCKSITECECWLLQHVKQSICSLYCVTINIYLISSWKVLSFLALWWSTAFVWPMWVDKYCAEIQLYDFMCLISLPLLKSCVLRGLRGRPGLRFLLLTCWPVVFTCLNNNLAQRLWPQDVNMCKCKSLRVIKGRTCSFTLYTKSSRL